MSEHIFYPDLKIVPVSDITLQEFVHKGRMKTLASAIKKEGILRNPPIVTNFFGGKYLHLDGANRITAVSMLGYDQCLVHVVDYTDPAHVYLMSWSHMIQKDPEQFLSALAKLPDVQLKKVNTFSHQALYQSYMLALLVTRDGAIYEITAKILFAELVRRMGTLVDLYADVPVERVFSASPWTIESIRERFERYVEKTMFLVFPTFSPQQVMTLVDQGVRMPAGITRHVVYRRKLNVNLPLSFLSEKSIVKANAKLQKFLQNRSVRLYEEPIIYFE